MRWVEKALSPHQSIRWADYSGYLGSGKLASSNSGPLSTLRTASRVLHRYEVGWRDRASWALGVLRARGRVFKHTENALFRTREAQFKDRFPQIHALILQSWAGGGLRYEGQFAQLLEVAEIIERANPRNCLELGSGVSSSLYAQLLRSADRFTTVEESPKFHAMLQSYLAPFPGCATSIRADRILTEREGEPLVHYAIDHSKHFDFVYVDGPSNVIDDLPADKKQRALALDPKARLANIDIELMWENGVFPKVIVIDGRRSTVGRLMRKSQDRYEVFLKSTYAYQATGKMPAYDLHHTVMWLKA